MHCPEPLCDRKNPESHCLKKNSELAHFDSERCRIAAVLYHRKFEEAR
ncbi:MAG: hypothetical protein LBL21_02925 [Rickettsiales bacterium]|nr:hypothetical protein [Rickettsiales bacterium]